MTAPAPIDIAALAKQAGIPADEPAVHEFARLVAIECVRISHWLPPNADLSWQPAHHIRAVTDDLSGRIMEAFDIGHMEDPSAWYWRYSAAMLAIDPRFSITDGIASARSAWIDRFAARLHELDPAEDLSSLEAVAERVLLDGRPWLNFEPGRAATYWNDKRLEAVANQSSDP